ncbi:hypothetical protein [Streptomyces sp. S3(2020)]|uniref:hypothetical protein n=1 Tax=Streptomyces sp. S3(2020) TaxID=2732044 RepID=UPI003217ABF6
MNGQKATHYRAVIDASRVGMLQNANKEGSLLNDMTGEISSITMDVWLGEKDLPVRLKQDMGRVKVTMDFNEFGATAAIKAPPAAQTADMTQLVQDSQQS